MPFGERSRATCAGSREGTGSRRAQGPAMGPIMQGTPCGLSPAAHSPASACWLRLNHQATERGCWAGSPEGLRTQLDHSTLLGRDPHVASVFIFSPPKGSGLELAGHGRKGVHAHF